MTWTTSRLCLLLALLSGCTIGLNEDNYGERQVAATCDLYARCAELSFYSEWDDLDECNEDGMDAWEDAEEYYEDCDFDEEKAAECLTAIGQDCKTLGEDLGDELEPCGEVWDCD